MPTGLTGAIYEGKDVTTAEFIFKCARHFGGLLHLRDTEISLDDVIPLVKVDYEYYDRNIATAKEELHTYRNFTLAEAAVHMDAEYQARVIRYNKRIEDSEQVKDRYTKAIEGVEAWEPPTEKHQALKDFAIQQLKLSLEHDCYVLPVAPIVDTPEGWLAGLIEDAKLNVTRWEERKAEEIQRVKEKNEWVAALTSSLRKLKEGK